jgi:hypothetical protein
MRNLTLALLALVVGCQGSSSTPAPTSPSSSSSPIAPPVDQPTAHPNRPGSEPLAIAAPDPAADSVACHFAWRRDVTTGHDPKNRRTQALAKTGTRESFALGDFAIDVAYESVADGTQLRIDVGDPTFGVHESYDFGKANVSANLPSAGHGFTGLRYVTHPRTKSELQYMCAAVARGQSLANDGWMQARPGPAAPASAGVRCRFEHLLRSGSWQVLEPFGDVTRAEGGAPTGRGAAHRTGVFTFAASYLAGGEESGVVMVDVQWGGATLRDFYQLMDDDRPSNLFAGAGFTGTRELEDRQTRSRLRYRCETTKG